MANRLDQTGAASAFVFALLDAFSASASAIACATRASSSAVLADVGFNCGGVDGGVDLGGLFFLFVGGLSRLSVTVGFAKNDWIFC